MILHRCKRIMISFRLLFLCFVSTSIANGSQNVVLDFGIDLGALPNDRSPSVARHNTQVLSDALEQCASSNTILIPAGKTFHLSHGVYGSGLHDAILQIDGSLSFERDFHDGRHQNYGPLGKRPTPCILLENTYNVTITSSSGRQRGVIDGGGPQWWGIPLLGYLNLQEHRPVLLQVNRTKDMLIENLVFQDAPLWTMKHQGVDGLTIRHSSIVSRRTDRDGHHLVDLSAFNTDGIDVAGHNVHVHDVDIWNQDDCIAVKDNPYDGLVSSNMTFERIHASGMGLTIGSIGGSTVQNITFRDCYLHKSFKGIYLKFREPDNTWDRPGLIKDVLFENITMEQPQQWGVWIGPAQQADSRNPCAPNPCSLCWPTLPFAECKTVDKSRFVNITLRDVIINNPLGSPGVIMGDDKHGIDGMIFDNVIVAQGPPISFPGGSRLTAFPGLEEPWNDTNVRRGYALWMFTLVLVVVSACTCLGRCICRQQWCTFSSRTHESLPQEDVEEDDEGTIGTTPHPSRKLRTWSEEKKSLVMIQPPFGGTARPSGIDRRTCWKIIFAMVFSAIIAWSSWWAVSVSRSVRDINDYFVCQGVSHADARGSTWPIPFCFNDDTAPEDASTNTKYRQRPSKAEHVLLVISVVFLMALCAMFMFLIWRIYCVRFRTRFSTPTQWRQKSFLFRDNNAKGIRKVTEETSEQVQHESAGEWSDPYQDESLFGPSCSLELVDQQQGAETKEDEGKDALADAAGY